MPRLAARLVAPVLLLLAVLAAPVRAGVSPFPPIDVGTVTAPSAGQFDFVLPLTLPFAAIPSSFDATVLYTAADAAEVLALAALGFTSPVTIGQVKSLMPAAAIELVAPTLSISNVTGDIGLANLGCDATTCTWRLTWNLDTPGVFGAHLEVQVGSVAIQNGGLLGVMLTLLYPLLDNFVEGYLHFDFVVRAAAPVPVPATGDAALAALGLALMGLAARALARRRRRDDD